MLAITYTLTVIGVTVGYHRPFTHRSFKTTRTIRALLAILGSAAVQRPVIEWVSTDRSTTGSPTGRVIRAARTPSMVRGSEAHFGGCSTRTSDGCSAASIAPAPRATPRTSWATRSSARSNGRFLHDSCGGEVWRRRASASGCSAGRGRRRNTRAGPTRHRQRRARPTGAAIRLSVRLRESAESGAGTAAIARVGKRRRWVGGSRHDSLLDGALAARRATAADTTHEAMVHRTLPGVARIAAWCCRDDARRGAGTSVCDGCSVVSSGRGALGRSPGRSSRG